MRCENRMKYGKKIHVENHIRSLYTAYVGAHTAYTYTQWKWIERSNRIEERTQFHELHKNHCHVDYSLCTYGVLCFISLVCHHLCEHWSLLFIYGLLGVFEKATIFSISKRLFLFISLNVFLFAFFLLFRFFFIFLSFFVYFCLWFNAFDD